MDILDCVKIGLKFKIQDIIENMNDDNFQIYTQILQKIVIRDCDDKKIILEYKKILEETTNTYFIKKKIFEFCNKYDNIHGILLFDKNIYQEQHISTSCSEKAQTNSLDDINDTFSNEEIIIDDYVFDIDILPPYERVVLH